MKKIVSLGLSTLMATAVRMTSRSDRGPLASSTVSSLRSRQVCQAR